MSTMQERAHVTPKDFFLWAGAMVALYWSVIAFISLMLSYIDYAFLVSIASAPLDNPYQSGISFHMAALLVMFPIYVMISRLIHKDIHVDVSKANLWVRKWALILTLFIAGLSMAIDLIVLLQRFFSGEELTTAFLMKVTVVLLVAAFGFMHFIADYWGFWDKKDNAGKLAVIGYATGILTLACITSGFAIIGTPQHARMVHYDAQKISDLTNLQWQIVNYWQSKHVLPHTLADLNDPISQQVIPRDPQTNDWYGYTVKGTLSFELCAEFNTDSDTGSWSNTSSPIPNYRSAQNNNWVHTSGHTCYTRTIDPQLYPPITGVKEVPSTVAPRVVVPVSTH